MAPPPINMGLQLFPPPPTKKAQGKFMTRRGVVQDQAASGGAAVIATVRSQTPEPQDGRQSAMSHREAPRSQSPMNGRYSPAPIHPSDLPPRSQSAMSQAPTLVRSNSNSSHHSNSPPKRMPQQRSASGPAPGSSNEPMIRSIFPRYNPEVPLDRQNYVPNHNPATSPVSAIPQSAISRSHDAQFTGRVPSVRSPLSAPATQTSFPRGVMEIPKTPEPSSTEELKQLWKCANGWRVSASEGRIFTLKMESGVDEPVHTLSGSGGAFYTMRVDPTSTSALISMSRTDPNKSSGKSSPILGVGKAKETGILEVLTTAVEEDARRHSPNDGLVATLCPRAAADMAIEFVKKSGDELTLEEAVNFECGRLVWDDDTSKYYLAHPALTTPFVVSISETKAWCRTEYTLEHPELPRNIVKLVRTGSGGGYLEIDTGVAARLDSFYMVDVAVAAILIVATQEEKGKHVERFEAPPTPELDLKDKKKVKVEEMEIDVESQTTFGKPEKQDKLPKPTKGALKILYWTFKTVVWVLTITVKMIAGTIIFVSKCLTRK